MAATRRKHQATKIPVITCTKMDAARSTEAFQLLNTFLRQDEFYLASSAAYGDRGVRAVRKALNMFLDHPELGFVWLAYSEGRPAAVCVVSYAISTSIGGLVAKLDDVFVATHHRRHGVATAMIRALAANLRKQGVQRIDTGVHRKNRTGEGLYAKLGFKSLGEERLAMVL